MKYFYVTPYFGLRSRSQTLVLTCLMLSPGSYRLSFSILLYYGLSLFIKIYCSKSFPIYIYTNIYIYMGIRLIGLNSFIFSELLCNPYKQVTFWLFVILNYIYIYEYKHIYIRLAVISYNLSISYEITDLSNAC